MEKKQIIALIIIDIALLYGIINYVITEIKVVRRENNFMTEFIIF